MSRWLLPANWSWVKANEIAEIVGGGTPPSRDPVNFSVDGIPWITPADLSKYDNEYISRGARSLSTQGLARSNAKIVPPDTVLFTSRAPIGKCVIAEVPLATSQGFKNLILEEGVEPAYVRHYLLASRDYAESLATGSTFLELSAKRMGEIEIPLPPTEEQRAIVAAVSAVKEASRTTNENVGPILELLREFRELVLRLAFTGELTASWRDQKLTSERGETLAEDLRLRHLPHGHGGKAAVPTPGVHLLNRAYFPESWGIIELQYVVEPGKPITYGILKPGPDQHEGIPYVRVSDFSDGNIDLTKVRRTTRKIASQYRRSELMPGDILLSIRGTVGRVCHVPAELAGGNITQDCVRIRVDQSMSREFVEYMLVAPDMQMRMANATRGVAVHGINVGDVRVLQLPLPPSDEQREIAERVSSLLRFAKRVTAEAQATVSKVRQLEKEFIDRAFRGEIYEGKFLSSADGLLERIRSRRLQRQQTRKVRKPVRESGNNKRKKGNLVKKPTTISVSHLSEILRDKGTLAPEALWLASGLTIDDFYDQLRAEERAGLLREVVLDETNAGRRVEAI